MAVNGGRQLSPPRQSPATICLLHLFGLAARLAIEASRILHLGALRCGVVHLAMEAPRTRYVVWRAECSGRRCDDVRGYVRGDMRGDVRGYVRCDVRGYVCDYVRDGERSVETCFLFSVLARCGSIAGVVGSGCGRKMGAGFSGL